MVTLFVLQVPEFAPLRDAAARKKLLTVESGRRYARISASSELFLTRAETGLGKAVWYGALTGGYSGKIVRFDDDELRIVSA
jgi:hypothetical protein